MTTFINNASLKHTIIIAACDTCAPISDKGYRVLVKLTAEQKQAVHRIDCEGWMSLLNDTTSDYAANLILYNIFDRDARVLSRRDSRELWAKYFKAEDIAYWKRKLCSSRDSGDVPGVQGQVSSDRAPASLMGYSVTSDLKGSEEGTYLIDINTGMPVSADISTDIEGTVRLEGREAKIKIGGKSKLEGKRLN